jgi:hypothetical protein
MGAVMNNSGLTARLKLSCDGFVEGRQQKRIAIQTELDNLVEAIKSADDVAEAATSVKQLLLYGFNLVLKL